jgi:aryl-alcohol dehydrogenase-like predicted oxidoreductase
MKYRKLGNSGVLVSSLSLGTMQFGRGMKMGSLGQDQTDGMVRFALDQGINLIDTADVYSRGESERE